MYKMFHLQNDMYFVDRVGIGQACLLCGSVIVPRKISIEDLQKAANEVFRINNGLRTRFIEKDGEVFDEYKPFETREFEVKRFSSKEEMDAWAKVYATIPLKLDIRSEGAGIPKSHWKSTGTTPELIKNIVIHSVKMFFTKMKMGMLNREPSCCELILVDLPDSCGAIIKMHHVISDGWTMMLVANQFLHILNGETPEAYDYEEFIANETAYLETNRFKKDREFYEKQAEAFPDQTWVWPEYFTSLEASRRTYVIDEDTTNKIREYVAKRKLTEYTVFLTAMCIFMSRKMKKDHFYVGSVTINRTGAHEKNTVGKFTHGIPLEMRINENDSFIQTVENIRDSSFSGFRHQKGLQSNNDPKKFKYDVWVSYQNASLEADRSAVLTQYYCNYAPDVTILSMEDRDGEGLLKMHFDHNIKVPESDVDELFATIVGVLKEAAADDSKKIGELYVNK